MKIFIIMALGALIGMFAWFKFGENIGRMETSPCEARYELRDTGIAGLSIRLDKQTGETKMVSALEAQTKQ